MDHPSTPQRRSSPEDFLGITPKRKETMTPGLQKFELPQVAFTSEFIPLEDPFGDEIPPSISLAEAIWSDYERSTCKEITSIHIDRQSAEPGPQINYEVLNQMIVNIPKRMPDAYAAAFKALANTRVRYFAAYQVLLAEKRTTADSFAMGKLLHMKQIRLQLDPATYGGELAAKNKEAVKKCFEECVKLKQRFEVCKEGLIRCMKEFIQMKAVVIPYIARLREGYVEIQRRHNLQKESERIEREKLEKERLEKKRAARANFLKEKAKKTAAALKEDSVTQARKAFEAQAWADYLARNKRLREDGTEVCHGRGGKRVNLGH
ncbi:uncharacterized protein GIQ15_02205 [Arthroderma uncinatum]|uniref:uncharacterized protein n=1 Tax=Arthroderma uncinatum TaxID=74035 RepID=UPI00144A9B66|nr:uncharacterized protein GIQ15_02205 [Arthroderma uncinatum]KAF3482881.1 hypothetical protein GIQ15_02205 [Arthroderma uncinatum]